MITVLAGVCFIFALILIIGALATFWKALLVIVLMAWMWRLVRQVLH